MVNLKNNNRKGSALVLVIMIMLVLSILGTVVLRVAVAESTFSKRSEDKLQAYYIARSGAQAVAEYMIKDPNNDAKDFIGKESSLNEQIGGGNFKVTVSEDAENNVVNIVSVGEYKGIQQKSKVVMSRTDAGVGGIFQYAIATKNGISVENEAGTGINIIGPLATKTGTIDLGKDNKNKPAIEIVIDPNLQFPTIVEPTKYDETFPSIANGVGVTQIITGSKTLYVSTGNITTQHKNDIVQVTGKGIVHMYVKGDILINGGGFDVEPTAKLYVYVIGNKLVKLSGNGTQNNIFLYAPDSNIEWNNANAGDTYGAIVGKIVKLHNHLTIKYNPDMVSDVELDHTNIGVTYTGYKWVD